jgi:hypothetical protein
MWGLPDFVFRPQVIAKGSGQRELGDATIITGSKAVAVQVKSREGEPKDDDAEGRWLTKKALQGARQAAGTVRALRASAADLANERGRTVTCHGDQLTWMGVVILDHAAPPPAFDVGIPVVAMLRRDWEFLFDHLRSVPPPHHRRATRRSRRRTSPLFRTRSRQRARTSQAGARMDRANRRNAYCEADPAQGPGLG